jgi:uncharacterized protein
MKVFCLVLAASLVTALPAAAQQGPRSITVHGSGSAAARPGTAVVRAGVETRAGSPEVALVGNNADMKAIFEILKKHGIAERDIATTMFDVQPVYGRPDPQGGTPAIQGYQVSNQVSARVRDIERLGPLLNALVAGGANRLRGVSFEIADPETLQDGARRAALQDARKRAELYAQTAGVRLGRVLTINEIEAPVMPMPHPMRMTAAAEAVPIAPGEHTVNAGITVTYEID